VFARRLQRVVGRQALAATPASNGKRSLGVALRYGHRSVKPAAFLPSASRRKVEVKYDIAGSPARLPLLPGTARVATRIRCTVELEVATPEVDDGKGRPLVDAKRNQGIELMPATFRRPEKLAAASHGRPGFDAMERDRGARR
jgi:hypothetical protein